ncbi:hypothetical protein IKG60_01160 [Candidatus Saccharibacteria bacterium]|nr:hypothetical protein [Candidatus Saccharibacteria bacterium]
MDLGIFFIVVILIVVSLGVAAITSSNGFLITIAIVLLPTSIIFLLCAVGLETSIEEEVTVESTISCPLAPLNNEVNGFNGAVDKYVVRGETQTSFIPLLEDGTREVTDVDNDYVSFDCKDGTPSVLIRKCSMTTKHHYSFVFCTKDVTQYTSYVLQVPEDAILHELSDGKYASLNLKPR